MDEYKQNFLEAPAQFATMDEVRALVSSYFTNLNQPIRMQSKSMESAGFTEATPTTSGNGWRIDAQGNCYFNDGHFRGDITGATGTFSGTVNVGSLNIPDSTTASSFHVNTTGDTWWGCNVADFVADHNNAVSYILSSGLVKLKTSITNTRIEIQQTSNTLKFYDENNNELIHLGPSIENTYLRLRTYTAGDMPIYIYNDVNVAVNAPALSYISVNNANSVCYNTQLTNDGKNATLYLSQNTGSHIYMVPNASAPTTYIAEGDIYYKQNSGLYYIDENLKHNKVNFVNSKEEDTFGFSKSSKTITDANTVSASSIYMVSTSIILEAHRDDTNGKIRFSKSTDSGATWSAPVDVGSGINTSDKYIYSADGTTIWIAYSNSTNLVVAKSTDGGANWTPANIQTDSMSGGGASMAGYTGDTLYVAYYSSTGAAKSTVRFTKSTDSGANFSASVGCGQSSTTAEPGAYRVSISMIDTDNAYVAFNYSSAGTDKLCCSRTSNGGANWTTNSTLDGGTGTSTSISAISVSGSKAIYAISNNAGTEIKVYKSTGGSFSLVNAYTPPGSNDNASIYTRGLSAFAFTWADIPGANYVMMLGVSEDSGANISSEQILASGGGGRPIYTSIHGISNGRMVIAAARDNNGNVQTDNSTAVQVLKISNVSVAPTVPIGGVYVYALAGELKSKDSAGNVTALS